MQEIILNEKDYEIDRYWIEDYELIVEAHTKSRFATCPKCQTRSKSIHSRYQRKPRDLPIVNKVLQLKLLVRRFRCDNQDCPQKTFVERLDLVGWYQHKTKRLTESLHQIGYKLGGAGGAALLSALHMQSSGDTLLRLVKQAPLKEQPLPKVIGVDDWAFRKGVTYGTIIVDLETRKPIDLLPDRTADTLANWLSKHPQITMVSRDRSSEYARGITKGSPTAQQIADRWHLLLNIRQMTERWTANAHQKLKLLPYSQELVSSLKEKRREPFFDTHKVVDESRKSRERRIVLYEKIQQLKQDGQDINKISKTLKLHWETARKYYRAESFPERSRGSTRPTIIDPFIPYLYKRLQEGCENGQQLWCEIKLQGYSGSAQQVGRWLSPRRSIPSPSSSNKDISSSQAKINQFKKTKTIPRLLGAKHLALLISCKPDRLSDEEQLWLKHIFQEPQVEKLYGIVQHFIEIICDRLADKFEPWVQDALAINISAVSSFVGGLKKDYSAIHAALIYPWSNGQVEGQVNRLKLINRQMYGRASFELLKARVLP